MPRSFIREFQTRPNRFRSASGPNVHLYVNRSVLKSSICIVRHWVLLSNVHPYAKRFVLKSSICIVRYWIAVPTRSPLLPTGDGNPYGEPVGSHLELRLLSLRSLQGMAVPMKSSLVLIGCGSPCWDPIGAHRKWTLLLRAH